jgi:phosphotriesterase-related protein
MPHVPTVLGPVEVASLGRTLMHEHIVLSHDYSCYLDWFPPGSLDDLTDWHYRHVSQDLLPYLCLHGVSDDQIDDRLVHTPARILGGHVRP